MSKGIERDCTIKCKSSQHGNQINSAITKRDVTDTELCAYINWMCTNCALVSDAMGRNALHVAASCGRSTLLKYLETQTLNINLKDYESGYSALHRAIFYGKIHSAVALIHLGANIHQLDNNDLSPLDHAMKDHRQNDDLKDTSLCQLYVWGTNTNYTLGMGHQHAKQLPDLNDAFHKKYPDVSVRQTCMSKFHSIVVSNEGRVFSCGHGQGGRLGLNTENTVLIPEEIQFHSQQTPIKIQAASVGSDHSIFLTSTGNVWTCGLNTHQVLGVKGAQEHQLQPRLVPHLTEIQGVCAGRFHSVAWTQHNVYTWGLHAGQLGHEKTSNITINTPKNVANFLMNKDTEIVHVAASNGATVVATKKGDVYVFHEYQIRKIASKQLNVTKVIVVGGHLNSKLSNILEKGGDELKILVLQTTGNLYLWQETWPQLSRCIYSLNRPLIITDAVLSRTQLFFVTADGEAFRGEFKTRKKRTNEITTTTSSSSSKAFHEFLNKNECQMIKVHRYPNIHRAVKIQCDLKGRNFSVIQCAPQCLLLDIPEISSKTIDQDFENLINNSDEMDAIHDYTFQISNCRFPVHRYIIATKSEQLDNIIESHECKEKPIELTNIHPIIFKQILMYIYTGWCDLLKCGKYKNEIKTSPKENPIGLLQQGAKRFGIKTLNKKLENYLYTADGYIQLKGKQKTNITCNKFDRRRFKTLQDVVIKSQNGEIHAHKCVLAARLEYFNNLFAVRWNEQTTNNKSVITLAINQAVMETIVEFLYTDEATDLLNTDDVDHISNVLIVSDQLFIERLKEICEVALSRLLTLKNCAYMLHFSSTYNALQLKHCIMEFICLNLANVLEAKILEILEDDILQDLTIFYCDWNKILCSRVITPYSDAPADETVRKIAELYRVHLDEVEKKTPKSLKSSLSGRKRTPRTRKESSKSTLEFDEPVIIINETKQTETDEFEWRKITPEKQKCEKIIQTRLRAIENAKDEVLPECNYTKLSPSTSSYIHDIPIQIGHKLSQKQRKKLVTTTTDVIISPPKIINPWQKIIPPAAESTKLQDILTDERKQKENWTKMRARPLIYSQMEDKAINDLERFYNVDQVTDECITIHKVDKGMIAVPLWVQHNN